MVVLSSAIRKQIYIDESVRRHKLQTSPQLAVAANLARVTILVEGTVAALHQGQEAVFFGSHLQPLQG
jgi:hypothetical protein